VALTDPIETPRLSLVLFTRLHMAALLGRGSGTFEATFDVPDGWAEEETPLLDYRLRQVERDPATAPWLLRAITFRGERKMIGHAGFHGPPDRRGFVEVGYSVFEPYRRIGIAHETAIALFAWAREHAGVAGFRASVSPGNEPSLRLVEKLGFSQVGVQWDEIDGEELVFERAAAT
jgi:ribosomal-protein-alanine N-acetyltransferase